MHNQVKDWMSTPVIVVDPDCSVSYALTLMRRRRIHSLIIDTSGDSNTSSYGIITSTDIRDKIIAAERDPAETKVSEIMTAPVITANPEWSLVQCSIIMQKHNFHHLPVADEQGTIIGMISDTDIFMAAEEIGWSEKT